MNGQQAFDADLAIQHARPAGEADAAALVGSSQGSPLDVVGRGEQPRALQHAYAAGAAAAAARADAGVRNVREPADLEDGEAVAALSLQPAVIAHPHGSVAVQRDAQRGHGQRNGDEDREQRQHLAPGVVELRLISSSRL